MGRVASPRTRGSAAAGRPPRDQHFQEAFRRREEGLRKKDLELQEQLIKFNHFLQENEAKRQRALRRAEQERKVYESKKKLLKEKQEELADLRAKSEELSLKLARHRRYEEYLLAVQEPVREDYPDVADLLTRHMTLETAFRDLTRTQQRKEQMAEEQRAEMADYVKRRGNEILNATNELAGLKKKLEHQQHETTRLQFEVDLAMRQHSDKTLVLGQVLMAIDNVLQRCMSKKRSGGGKSGDGARAGNALKALSNVEDLASRENQVRGEGGGRGALAGRGGGSRRWSRMGLSHIHVASPFSRPPPTLSGPCSCPNPTVASADRGLHSGLSANRGGVPARKAAGGRRRGASG